MKPKTLLSSVLVYAVVRLLLATYRFRLAGEPHRQVASGQHPRGSFCIALWHEQLLPCILAHRGQPFAPLASLSSDGDIVTWVMRRFGFRSAIRGSSSRGGEEARDELVQIMDRGWFTAVTVDGPRGPRRRVKGGVVDVARRSGVAILPLVAVADRAWVLRSWDEFKIPKPFARIAVRYAEPVTVPETTQGLAFGAAKAQVKQGLEAAEAAAREDLAAWGRRHG